MDSPAREPSIAAFIRAIDGRSARDADRFAAMLERHSWPSGSEDRLEPGALEWVRRWGPGRLTAEPLDCSCAHGRCAVCN